MSERPSVLGYGNRAEGSKSSSPPVSEEFLYHLYRGSEMLLSERVVEAKEELERALALQPQDARGQDLLAGVYFRLGLYPQAIDIWSRLVEGIPQNATLRINLGLALFKTGQPERARDHLLAAVGIDVDHGKAWGYLGLVNWRLGRLKEARDAFLRGGQAAMARRMEESLSSVEESPAKEAPAEVELEDGDLQAMRAAAEHAIAELERTRAPLSVDRTASGPTTGRWRTLSPGEEVVPRVPRPRTTALSAPPTLRTVVGASTFELPDGTPLGIAPGGELVIQASQTVNSRIEGLSALRGELRTKALPRRLQGRELDEILGGQNPIFTWYGPIVAFLEPSDGGRFQAMTLEEGDVLFVREDLLWAFESGLDFESGRLPLAGRTEVLTQLHGRGTVVLHVTRPPKALRVGDGQEVRVEPKCLVGWTGRLFPSTARGTAPYSGLAPVLAFRGEGYVLLE